MYTVTVYIRPLPSPEPPARQVAPMTLQQYHDFDQALACFKRQIDLLDVGCVQLWHSNRRRSIGRFYI